MVIIMSYASFFQSVYIHAISATNLFVWKCLINILDDLIYDPNRLRLDVLCNIDFLNECNLLMKQK